MFQKSTTLSPSTRFAFYAIVLLLLSCSTQRASSMSLERLGLDQNDLNSAAIAPANNYEEQTETDNGAADIVVDDMELEAVPTNGNTDTYLLVPASGAAERESVEKNTIESVGDSNGVAEEPQPNEATDMLMVESNDSPMHVSLLAVPAEQSELADADQVAKAEEIINDDESVMDEQLPNLDDKILEIPIEPELHEVVPVVAVEVPVESIEKVDKGPSSVEVEHGSRNEDTVSAEHETIADMIADAVLEVEKDMESLHLADELPSNVLPFESEILDESQANAQKNEETDNFQENAEQDAIENVSAMEEELLPEIISVPVEAVHIEQEKSEENTEPLHISDSTVEDENLEENEIKEAAKEHSVENKVSEESASKPDEIIANVEPGPEHIMDIQPESTINEDNPNVEELSVLTDTIIQSQSEENKIANSNQEPENKNTEDSTKIEKENVSVLKDEIKADASEDGVMSEEHEVNPMVEAIEKEIDADLAERIAEDSKLEETIAEEMTPNGDHVEDNKQVEKITEDKHTDETQIVEEVQQTENDQIAEESQTAEELQAIEEIQAPEENQLIGETQSLEENQLAEAAQKTEDNQQQVTMDNTNVAAEAIMPEAANHQLDEISQDAMVIEESLQEENMENLAEETLPVGEVAEIATPEEIPADNIAEQEPTAENVEEDNKLEEAASEDIKEDAPIVEESQQEEIKEEQVEQQVSEANGELSESEQKQELNKEEETEVNQADLSESTVQNNSQQITEEKLEEDSVPIEEEAAHETQKIVGEKLEEVKKLTETETQPEAQNFGKQQEQEQPIPAAELVQKEEQQPETPIQLVENQEQQQEAQETTSEELLQQAVAGEAQEILSEELQQSVEEQEVQEAEQTLQQVAEQQPSKEAEETVNLQQAEEHLEEQVQLVKQEEPAIQQQQEQEIAEEQPQTEAQMPEVQQILADAPAQVPLELVTESLSSAPIEPTNSLLTTIIQVPQQQQQIPQQPSPVKVENDKAPLTATLVGVNSPPAAAAASTVAPLNVMDSVLNYVNASFMQLNGNKQQLTTQNLKDDDDADLNAQLRRYDGAQVWRIVVQSDHDRKMADELQTKYGKCGQ